MVADSISWENSTIPLKQTMKIFKHYLWKSMILRKNLRSVHIYETSEKLSRKKMQHCIWLYTFLVFLDMRCQQIIYYSHILHMALLDALLWSSWPTLMTSGCSRSVIPPTQGPYPNKPSTHLPRVLTIRTDGSNPTTPLHNTKTSAAAALRSMRRVEKRKFLKASNLFATKHKAFLPFWKVCWSAGLTGAGPPRQAARQPALLWPH